MRSGTSLRHIDAQVALILYSLLSGNCGLLGAPAAGATDADRHRRPSVVAESSAAAAAALEGASGGTFAGGRGAGDLRAGEAVDAGVSGGGSRDCDLPSCDGASPNTLEANAQALSSVGDDSAPGTAADSTVAVDGDRAGAASAVVLFAHPSGGVGNASSVGDASVAQGAASRRLEATVVPIDVGWQFPSGTTLRALTTLAPEIFGSGAASAQALTLMAGYKYMALHVEVPEEDWTFESTLHENGVFNMRSNIFSREECASDDNFISMGITQGADEATLTVGAMSGGELVATENDAELLTAVTAYPHLIFQKGGDYRMCYAPDGTFSLSQGPADNNLVPIPLTVVGISSGCLGDGCVEEERWDCYFSYRAEYQGPCYIDIRDFGERKSEGWGIRSTGNSRFWWSQEWEQDLYITFPDSVEYRPGEPQLCSETLEAERNIEPETDRFQAASLPEITESGAGVPIDGSRIGRLPQLKTSTASTAFTLTLCYCPNHATPRGGDAIACDHESEFIQPFGRAYYWMLRVCGVHNFQSCGVGDGKPYMRILPQQPFVLRLQCPSGGRCAESSANKIRFIEHTAGEPEYPPWHRLHKCKMFPPPPSIAGVRWVLNEGEDLDSLNLNGGERRDYKVWSERPLIANLSAGTVFDVCYCDENCEDGYSEFFKVGSLSMADSMGVARWTQDLDFASIAIDPIETIEFVGKLGAVTLLGGITSPLDEGMHPYDSVIFSRPALMKLVSYDGEALDWGGILATGMSDEEAPAYTLEEFFANQSSEGTLFGRPASTDLSTACGAAPYRGELIDGPNEEEVAKEWKAHISGDDDISQYLPFTGANNDQTFIALKAGNIVVCYCATFDDTGNCAGSNFWVSVAMVMVRGPVADVSLFYPNNFVIQMELDGWGFTSNDTLRLIGTTQACGENGFRPRALDFGYRLGCPGVNGSTCRMPTLDEDIQAFVEGSDTTGFVIAEVVPGEASTRLVFSGDIVDVLVEGDAITLDEDTLLLNGKERDVWTAAERFEVAKISGFYEFADDSSKQRMLWNRVYYVYRLGSLVRNELALPVGWAENAEPIFTPRADADGIGWARRNKLSTNQELKADGPDPITMKLCWAATDGGEQKYYATVGEVTFKDPDFMYDAGVFPTTSVIGAKAPAVITVTPSIDNSAYREMEVPMVLRLVFKDLEHKFEPILAGELSEYLEPLEPDDYVDKENASQALCGMLFTEMWTNDNGGFPVPRGCYYGPQHTDQPSILDDGSLEIVPTYREIFIMFEPKQGMKSRCLDYRQNREMTCVYMLTFNARIWEDLTDPDEEVVGVYTMCEGSRAECGRFVNMPPVIEYGPGKPSLTAQAGGGESALLREVRLSPRGADWETLSDPIALEGTIPDDPSLNEFLNLDIRAWVANTSRPILRLSVLRIFFTPFGAWDLGLQPQCQAMCEAAPNATCSDGRGGNMSTCMRLEVTNGLVARFMPMPKNVLEVHYPRAMDELYDSDDAHTIAADGIDLPNRGFFPRRYLAQLTLEDGTAPSTALTNAAFRLPQFGATRAQILIEGQTRSGSQPFVGYTDNDLVVKILLGATLRHIVLVDPPEEPREIDDVVEEGGLVDDTASNSDNITTTTATTITTTSTTTSTTPAPPYLEIRLPDGYICHLAGKGGAITSGAEELFGRDENGDGVKDNYNQTLTNGFWSTSRNTCKFTLEPYAQLWAGQIFYVQLKVDNPFAALLKDDADNVWSLDMRGTAAAELAPVTNFITLEEEEEDIGWAGNVAVLTPLTSEAIQTTEFGIGLEGYVHVFFRATHSMANESHIVLDAPDDFDFGLVCEASDLDPLVYTDWEGLAWGEMPDDDRAQTFSIGPSPHCSGDNWKRLVRSPYPESDFTRAIVRVNRALLGGTIYAFRIHVRNARNYDEAQHINWKLWIQSPKGYFVDGSIKTILFNEPRNKGNEPISPYDRSWGVYKRPLNSSQIAIGFIGVDGPSVLPTRSAIMPVLLTLYPLAVSEDGGLVNARLIAPVGYEFLLGAFDSFIGTIPGVTCEPHCVLVANPRVLYKNELILPDLVIRVGFQYGFQVRVQVPDRSPTRSTNAFFLELGYDSGSMVWQGGRPPRLQAGMIAAPALRVVHDARVYALSNAAFAKNNIIEFHLRIASPLNQYDGFVLTGDRYTRLTDLPCYPTAVPWALPLPTDMYCDTYDSTQEGLPVVILTAMDTPLPAGHYGIRFVGASNPAEVMNLPGTWTMGTFKSVHTYPQSRVLDQAVSVPAERVRSEMRSAGMLSPSSWEAAALGRDDRPLAVNTLTFYFTLRARPLAPSSQPGMDLAIRGPKGFIFAENCTASLQVLGNFSHWLSQDHTASFGTSWPCSEEGRPSQPWCPETITSWPRLLLPTACLGIGETAKITIPNVAALPPDPPGCGIGSNPLCVYSGFEPELSYAFQISVQNPVTNRTTTQWAMDFGYEASDPFETFSLASFAVETTVLRAVSAVRSLYDDAGDRSKVRPVSIYFAPSQNITGPRAAGAEDRRRLQSDLSLVPLTPQAAEGVLKLSAPAGFSLSCIGLILERAGRHPANFEQLFEVGFDADVICRVLDSSIELTLQAFSVLQADVVYRLVTFVLNPQEVRQAEDWELASMRRRPLLGTEVMLDRISLPGYPVIDAVPKFEVDNLSGENIGLMEVLTARLSLIFNSPLREGDVLVFSAPSRMDLRAEGDETQCRSFRFLSGTLPLPRSPAPVCLCEEAVDGLRCNMQVTVNEGSATASNPHPTIWDAGLEFVFDISPVNPPTMPDPVENYWKLEHRGPGGSSDILAGQLASSWDVFGQIDDISLQIVGLETRAGAETDLQLSFRPTAWASALSLTFDEPEGFDFSGCRPASPMQRDPRTSGGFLVLTDGYFDAAVISTVFIAEVVLAPLGGQTRIQLRLFSDATLDEGAVTAEVARRPNYLLGFALSGRLSVLAQYYWSTAVIDTYEAGILDRVQPLLPTHAGKYNRVELLFSVTSEVMAGESITLTSTSPFGDDVEPCVPTLDDAAVPPGRRAAPSIALCNESTGVDGEGLGARITGSSGNSTCTTESLVTIANAEIVRSEDLTANGINMTLTHSGADGDDPVDPVLEAGRVYRLRAWCRGVLTKTWWRLQTEDGSPYPTNTNDALEEVVETAAEMIFQVSPFTARVPPASLVRVAFRVRAAVGQGDVSLLRVVMPEGFVLFENGSPIGDLDAGGRPVLSVDSTVGSGDVFGDEGRSFELEVRTPPFTPIDTRWFVIAQEPDGAPITGWGINPGFGVQQLPISIIFPSSPLFSGWVAASFTIPVVRAPKYAVVSAPKDFLLKCPQEVDAADAPTEFTCTRFDNSRNQVRAVGQLENSVNVSLTMDGTPEGSNFIYSVILWVDTPEVPQSGMLWDVRVLNEGLNIVDGSINTRAPTSGSEWMEDFWVERPRLFWGGRLQALETQTAMVDFTFTRRVKEVRALLIVLPERYRHDILSGGQLKCANQEFPLASNWRVFEDNLRWVKIITAAPTLQALDFLPGGTVRFTFPVMIPEVQPARKEWYVALCRNATCSDVENANPLAGGDVFVSIPVPNIAEVAPPQVFTNTRAQLAGTFGSRRKPMEAVGIAVVAIFVVVSADAAVA